MPFPLIPVIIGAIVAIVTIGGAITIAIIIKEMQKRNISGCIVDLIDGCENKIKLNDLYSSKTFKIEGESISDDLYEGMRIYI